MAQSEGKINATGRAFQAVAIACAGTWAFSSSLSGGWLWDDDQYVGHNPALRSLGGLWRSWLAPPGVNYFPLADTVRWVQWHLWGPNPFGYRLTNLALHILSAFLVWWLAGKLARVARGRTAADSGSEGVGPWIAGLLFAVHPMAVESVAWVSELKNTLSLPLLLLSMGAYIEWERDFERDHVAEIAARGNFRHMIPSYRLGRTIPFYGLSLVAFVAAMLSKSSVGMLPVVLVLYTWWRHGRVTAADLKAIAPFFFVLILLGAVSVHFERTRALRIDSLPIGGIGTRFTAAGLASIFYLGKLLWPFGLLPIYPRWAVAPALPLLMPWPLLAAVAAWLWAGREAHGRHLLFGLGSLLLNLVPTLGIVPVAYLRFSWVADHFAYVALANAAILGGLGLEALAAHFVPRPRAVVASVAVVAGLFLAGTSRSYARNFKNPEAEWTDAVRRDPSSWAAWSQLAGVRFDQGRMDETVAAFRQALRLRPDYAEGHSNLGVALTRMGDLRGAIAQYEAAIRIRPNYVTAHCNLGNALLNLGHLDEAVEQYEEALKLNPGLRAAHYDLGLALRALGRGPEADVQFGLAH